MILFVAEKAMSLQGRGAVPAASVVMAVYNAEPWLVEAVDSVLGQTFADFELVVVDDSVDATPKLCASFAIRGFA